MKHIIIKSTLTVLISFAFILQANAQFTLSGEFRTRAEANNGYKYIPVEDDITQYYVTQRTRLNAMYKSEKYDAYLSLQDVRSWGGEDIYTGAGVWGYTHGLDIYQAWINLKLGEASNLKIGRQELKYNDQRLLSWRNWNQYGLTYDALVFKTQKNDWRFDLGLSYNSLNTKITGDVNNRNNRYYADKNRIKTLNFLYLERKFNDAFTLSFTGIHAGYAEAADSDTVNNTLTYGFYAKYAKNGLDFTGNAFLQGGKNKNGQDIEAYFLTADAGYKFNSTRLGLGADLISGHDASNTDADYADTDHTFNLMYGARFKYYGWINHFILMDKHTRNGGLIDIYPNVTHKFNKSTTIKAFYHLFSTEQEVPDGNGGTFDKSLGSALDLMFIKGFSKEVKLQAGLSYSMPSETLEAFKGATDTEESPFWGWVMLTIKPTFFKK